MLLQSFLNAWLPLGLCYLWPPQDKNWTCTVLARSLGVLCLGLVLFEKPQLKLLLCRLAPPVYSHAGASVEQGESEWPSSPGFFISQE